MEQVKTVVDKPDFEKMAEDWARDNDWPADYTIYEPLKEGYKAGAEKIWNDYLSTPKPEAVVSLQELKHTALPWRRDEMNSMSIIDNGAQRFDSLILQTNGKNREEAEANLAFVLEACNNHYQFKEENERLKAKEIRGDRMIVDLEHTKTVLTSENTRLREALEAVIKEADKLWSFADMPAEDKSGWKFYQLKKTKPFNHQK
jgi:hypothetical protein